jgi:acyl-CoA synthetase (AMP-forming)/AMP-acid ligase II
VIVNPDTRRACAPDEIGEIWVSGPSVAQGYWKRDEESAYTFDAHLEDSGRGPFLRTGDMGFLQDGELFVTGRLKDLIIIRGRNHYPQDIELTVQRAHPSLRGAGGVITIERDGRERLVVVNEISRGPKRDPQELAQIYEAVRKSVSAEHDLNVEAIVLLKAGSIPKTSSEVGGLGSARRRRASLQQRRERRRREQQRRGDRRRCRHRSRHSDDCARSCARDR